MELKEIIPIDGDKYLVQLDNKEMNNYEAIHLIKETSKIVYFPKGKQPTFKDLNVRDNLKKIYDEKTVVRGFFDCLVKNGSYYNLIVIVEGYIGLKSVLVGLLDEPTIIRKDGEIIDIIL